MVQFLSLIHISSELLRKVEAAQFVASHDGEVCPAKWKKGESVSYTHLDVYKRQPLVRMIVSLIPVLASDSLNMLC